MPNAQSGDLDRTSMNDLRALKSELRRELRSEAGRFSAAERAAASIQICQRLEEQPVWKKARGILFFSPLPGETEIHPLLSEALAGGKPSALPGEWTLRDG